MKATKNFKAFVVVALSLIVCSCVSGRMTEAERQQRAAQKAQTVADNISNRRFTIDITYMSPNCGPAKHVDYGFELETRGDSVVSYLPYFGRAYNVPYGGGKGLNFSAPTEDWTVNRPKDNMWQVDFNTNNGEDRLHYQIEIYSDGSSHIDVWATERDPISFVGQMR